MIRLNDNGRHPNPLIYFIKPLTKAIPTDVEVATQTLNRLAAIVFPIMKQNGLIVKSLAECKYNGRFLGQNFNAGELIELVLRNSTGEWLPETFVLSVLLHELSHCTNMHHGRSFWSTLALYKDQMQGLIQKGYTGEGFWGRGKILKGSGDQSFSFDLLPLQVCGGIFKRFKKAKTQIKARMRSIPKRFSAAGEGVKIGIDLDKRLKLTGGKVMKGRPRVAQSKRGNELRLNAALARANSNAPSTSLNKYFGDEGPSSEADEWDLIVVDGFERDDFVIHDFNESAESREFLEKERREDLFIFDGNNRKAKGSQQIEGNPDIIVID